MAKNLDFSQNYLQEPSINTVENEAIVLSTKGDGGRGDFGDTWTIL